jgi:hypothetical protein
LPFIYCLGNQQKAIEAVFRLWEWDLKLITQPKNYHFDVAT